MNWSTATGGGTLTGTGLNKPLAFWTGASVLSYSANIFYDSATSTINNFSGLGSEKVTNGTFTGSATGWTVGSGYAYSSNSVSHTSNGTATLNQNVNVFNGEYYVLTYDISAMTTGTVTPSLGGFTGTTISADQTGITEYVPATSTANLTFTPSNTARFTIDNVSVKKYSGGNIRTGSVYTNDLTVSASTSNTNPGTTHHISLKNPSGAYTPIVTGKQSQGRCYAELP